MLIKTELLISEKWKGLAGKIMFLSKNKLLLFITLKR